MTKKQLNLETSQIPWHELQRFFASGLAISVSPELDLLEVAFQFSKDNKVQVEQWLQAQSVALVSDQQALQWYNNEQMVWAVVVKPWVLVQDQADEKH
jgi:hypothetical protein